MLDKKENRSLTMKAKGTVTRIVVFKKKNAWHFDIHIHMLNVYIRYA